jgi:hypothetical protein
LTGVFARGRSLSSVPLAPICADSLSQQIPPEKRTAVGETVIKLPTNAYTFYVGKLYLYSTMAKIQKAIKPLKTLIYMGV